ncbi:MAG: carboxypeptidase regulatory-like domain-containing protein [Proteobacteria bacterium]|nr:carboxypeptidase regulatory-like domain-containing protein [Pseudomonadota bacterium]
MGCRQSLCVAWLVLSLGGCMGGREVKIDQRFDPVAAAYINKSGESRIDGHAFLKKPNGRAMNAVGDYVWLIPATPYAKERMKRLYGNAKFMPASAMNRAEETDPKFYEFTRKTKAESNGRFTFDKVAPGEYFIATNIVWKDDEYDVLSRGGAVYEAVTVTGKEERIIRVVVNGM